MARETGIWFSVRNRQLYKIEYPSELSWSSVSCAPLGIVRKWGFHTGPCEFFISTLHSPTHILDRCVIVRSALTCEAVVGVLPIVVGGWIHRGSNQVDSEQRW
eukprot:m.55996 g.55996  ORF g.55996 m.55996 type:complete len:103 (+) comp16929_c0_seq1:2456-2764(+)